MVYIIESIGKYLIFLLNLVRHRERFKVYPERVLDEAMSIGWDSLPIVAIVSTFIGAVTTIQTAYNLISPLVPNYIISNVTRDMTVLELSPTIISIVLAGRVGSNIAGELGTMRITEQIDALDVMGVNSISLLVLPKIVAAMLTFPMLVVLSMCLSLVGGYFAGSLSGELTPAEFIYGIRYSFNPYMINFAIYKCLTFSFLISSISSFKGYYTVGGALEVGKASTEAVTNSCIAVLLADYLLAKLLL